MFERFVFTKNQISKYHSSALRDFKIAKNSLENEVRFRFCYDALLKLSITVCAKNNLRIKSRQDHHIKLIEKMAEILKDKDINIIGQEMRAKRNWDLYGGGILISEKEAKDYLQWTENIFKEADKYFNTHSRLF